MSRLRPNRLRLAFATITLLLLVPVGLLVRHALDNLETERLGREQAVAERVFDEMERELTSWLRLEEDRPFGHYRYLFIPEGPAEPHPDRSPLADGPDVPFVLAHFQVDPDGTVSSPLWPVDADRAASALGWRMDALQETRRDEILGLLTDLVLRRTPPGSGARARAKGDDGGGSSDLDDPNLLSRLNRGLQSRQGRTTRVEQSQALNVLDFTQKSAKKRPPSPLEDPSSIPEGEDEPPPDLFRFVSVSLEPMVGRHLEGNGLLLYRTVVIEDRAYRQGMVIDGPALVDWLGKQVLAPPPLAAKRDFTTLYRTASSSVSDPAESMRPEGAEVSWWSEAEDMALDPRVGEGGPFRHRFAEPFGSVAAEVRLDPLPRLPATLYIYSLAALLGLTATLGFYALYRTVAVEMAFAERRNNFASAVTHELKTPLTAIRMYGEMLRDGLVADDDHRQDYYRILTAEAERLTRLIHNVLELSRLEKQTRRFELRSGDPRDALAAVAEVLGPHAEQKGFVLELDDDGPAEAIFDRDALAQVLFNLVDNAVKYAEGAEDRRVELRCSGLGDRVRLSVADRGPGVARKHLRTIFEPFYRGEDELTRRTKGTGIGLSLVQGLVEQMGGTVRGRNRDGGGFEVIIDLPAA